MLGATPNCAKRSCDDLQSIADLRKGGGKYVRVCRSCIKGKCLCCRVSYAKLLKKTGSICAFVTVTVTSFLCWCSGNSFSLSSHLDRQGELITIDLPAHQLSSRLSKLQRLYNFKSVGNVPKLCLFQTACIQIHGSWSQELSTAEICVPKHWTTSASSTIQQQFFADWHFADFVLTDPTALLSYI